MTFTKLPPALAEFAAIERENARRRAAGEPGCAWEEFKAAVRAAPADAKPGDLPLAYDVLQFRETSPKWLRVLATIPPRDMAGLAISAPLLFFWLGAVLALG